MEAGPGRPASISGYGADRDHPGALLVIARAEIIDATMARVAQTGVTRPRSLLAARGVDVVQVVGRELRLLIGLLLLLFMTSETWRYVGRLTAPRLAMLVLVVLAATLLIVVVGLRLTLEDIHGPVDTRRATNRIIGEVAFFAMTLFLGFGLLGVVTVDAGLVAEWTGGSDEVLVSLALGSPPFALTRSLLQVSAFLASLGALAFAVEAISDPGTRHTLLRDLVDPEHCTGHHRDSSQ